MDHIAPNSARPLPLREADDASLHAATDRPADTYSEINPPPHAEAPIEPVDELARLQAQTGIEQLAMQPPPVPGALVDPSPRPETAESLAQQLGELAQSGLNHKLAFMAVLVAATAHTNYLNQALGELRHSDCRDYPAAIGGLLEATTKLQARLLAIESASTLRQAAE